MIQKTQVAISGGGPAGIMLGFLLARKGIDVVVLEKYADFFRDFRGDTIHPSTMENLKELGLLDEFMKLPHSEMTRMTMNFGSTSATIADLSHLKTACPFIAFIPQWDFLNFMSKKAKQYSSFHLMMNTEATGLVKKNGRVVGLRAKGEKGSFEIESDLVVGADGRHSMIRDKGGFEVESFGVPIDVLWFRLERNDKDNRESLIYLDGDGALIMLDRHDYWQCGYIISKGDLESVKAQGIDKFRAKIVRLSRLNEKTVAQIDSWDKVKLLSVTVDHVKKWAKEGVVLIGDAAHAMSPVGGVGINYAIQDAVAAANILIPEFANGVPDLKILEKIEKRRRRPTLRMQRVQVFLQDKVLHPIIEAHGKLRAPWLFKLFNWIPILRRIPAHIVGIGFQPEHIRNDSRLMI